MLINDFFFRIVQPVLLPSTKDSASSSSRSHKDTMLGQSRPEAKAAPKENFIPSTDHWKSWWQERGAFEESTTNDLKAWCWIMICRKLPLPEIFYNNNELEHIDNLSDKEEDNVENQDDHDR